MIKELWYEIRIPGDYGALSRDYGVSPVMARLLVNRLSTKEKKNPPDAKLVGEYLAPGLSRAYEYAGLPDIEKCIDILTAMIRDKKRIRVIGDYDIDGVCATYILTSGLHKAGADVSHMIPHRITDGYGLNERLIRKAHDAGVDCIITCDNGISARDQTKLAHKLGMTVIITDHHEVPYHMEGELKVEDMPEADAVVDIKRKDSGYGFTEICGAAVAFKVITALFDRLHIDRSETQEYIELAAFATIGDIMPLTDENRGLVREGLIRLKDTENKGLRALIRAQAIADTDIRPYHVGFVLGPCINATGRLATADNAYELLASDSYDEAERTASMLVAMNNDRKDMTEKGTAKAMDIALDPDMAGDRVLVIYLKDTHESVAGIIAGRVKERTGKPAFVLTDGESGIKGSGRSIDEYDMHEAMTEVSDLFDKYGGHKMAGGLSLKKDATPDMLRQRLNSICTLTDTDLAVKLHFDMQLPFARADMALVEDMRRLEPFGAGNPRPLFAAKDVTLRNIGIYGRNNNTLKCSAVDAYGTIRDAVYFGDAEAFAFFARSHDRIKILYCPDINEYRGSRSLQIKIEHYSA